MKTHTSGLSFCASHLRKAPSDHLNPSVSNSPPQSTDAALKVSDFLLIE